MSEALNTLILPSPSQKQSMLEVYRATLGAVVRHPASWCFAIIWISAVLCLYLTGHASYIRYAVPALLLVLLCAFLSIQLTRDAPPEQEKTVPTPSVLGIQLMVLIGLIILSSLLGFALHNIIIPLSALPLWFIGGLPLFEPILYFVLPLIVLLLTRTRRSDVGLGKGWHPWRVIALFLALRLLFGFAGWLSLFYATPIALVPLLQNIILNVMESGFFEEFLFRGALQTRLSLLFSPAWALILTSLLFGLWHLGSMTQSMGGNFLAGAAATIVNQATLGLLYGILFMRTRNLLAPSIVHLIANIVM